MSVSLRNALRSVEQASGPASPSSGQRLLYPKSDGWYQKDSAGVESKLAAQSGTKISALPAASLPLDGTETVALVKGGATVRATVNDLSEFIRAKLTSDATSTSVTPAAIAALDCVLPVGTYNVKLWMVLRSAATTTGMTVFLNASGGTVTTLAGTWYSLTTGTTATSGVMDQASAAATFQTMEGRAFRASNTDPGAFGGVDTANADQFAVLEAIAVVTAQTTMRVMFASEVASSQVTMRTGSNIRYAQV